jgi:acyl-CoA reductase-like NAD-dependent aldehyde dehydrogenase
MPPGNPLDRKTRLGPVVSKEQFDRVDGYLAEGKREGAKVTTGEGVHEGKGYYIKPTVFADVTNKMKIAVKRSSDRWRQRFRSRMKLTLSFRATTRPMD